MWAIRTFSIVLLLASISLAKDFRNGDKVRTPIFGNPAVVTFKSGSGKSAIYGIRTENGFRMTVPASKLRKQR